MTITSSNIRHCRGVEFELDFEVGGNVASGIPGDPEFDLFCNFLKLSVRISDDNWIDIKKENDAAGCIGTDVLEDAKDVCVRFYLESDE